jgi:hypothetical protein
LDIIEPEDAPEDLCQVEGIVVEPLEGAVEVGFSLPVDLNGDE